MNLDAALKKLEWRAKPALRCAWCLYSLTDLSPAKQALYKRVPTAARQFFCRWCGTDYMTDLTQLNEREREAYIVTHSRGVGDLYRDERVFAAGTWWDASRTLKWWRETEDREKLRRKQRKAYAARDKKRLSPAAQRRAEVRKKAYAFFLKMDKWEREKFGPGSFPLAVEVAAIEESKPDAYRYIPGTYRPMSSVETRARECLCRARVMEACERVLWGAALPETTAAVAEFGAVIQGFEDERAQKAREEEERKRREGEERQRREAERLARLAAPATPPASDSDMFWLRDYAPQPEAQPTRIRFRKQPDPNPDAEPPLTPELLRVRLVQRCGGDEPLRRLNEWLFDNAARRYDEGKLLSLAGVSDEERQRRGFSWADGTVTSIAVPEVR